MSDTTQTSLSQPLYGAGFGQAVSRFFKKYATFSGRASLSEFWWLALFLVIVNVVLWVLLVIFSFAGAHIDAATGVAVPGPGLGIMITLMGLWNLAIIVPELAIVWRRLHDTNRSGGFFFLALIPAVGGIILLVLVLMPTDPAGARFDQ